MKPDDDQLHDYLRRLPTEHYRGQSFVHWSMTIDDRKKGWLVPIFYYNFVKFLRTVYRYGIGCPIFCCMPDHIHLLWIGILEGSDQRNAVKYFRKQLNPILENLGVRFQKQPYDRVLRLDERERCAFETVVEYIARNPERAGLVKQDGYRDYAYSGCLVPGCPELNPWQTDYWDRFWRIHEYLRKNGFHQLHDEDRIS